jgi:hypothetical protein
MRLPWAGFTRGCKLLGTFATNAKLELTLLVTLQVRCCAACVGGPLAADGLVLVAVVLAAVGFTYLLVTLQV